MPSERTPVYEVISGSPTWGRLYRLATEATAQLAFKAVKASSKAKSCNLDGLRNYFNSELPADLVRDVLNVCLARDRFRCHHNPTECMALELWRVFYNDKFTEVSISHHAFAFPKTTNYPEIVTNLERLLSLFGHRAVGNDAGGGANNIDDGDSEDAADDDYGQPPPLKMKNIRTDCNASSTVSSSLVSSSASKPQQQSKKNMTATTTSFKLELKQCEVGCLLQDKVVGCVASMAGGGLRVLELPGLGSDELLHVIALYCTNLEVLNVKGSREAVTDAGFGLYVKLASAKSKLNHLDVSRCMLTQQALLHLQSLTGLKELKVSTRILDEIHYSCDGSSVLQTEAGETLCLEKIALPHVESVTVEHENSVQVSINKVMSYLRHVFPKAVHVALTNCIACELHVTLTQQPTNITYMRQHIHTLELISADYFHFPRLVYPCPNLVTLHIEKPTNDVFNIDAQNVPFLYGNTVPFSNLKNLKLSRISLTNLTHFLSKSSNLRQFKVTNIGRRERPRWTDERIQQILPPDSVPNLEEFHVSCLPSEGFSSVETHRYLHLTQATVRYLTENFASIQRIAGIESWNPRDTNRVALNTLLNVNSQKNSNDHNVGSSADATAAPRCNSSNFAVISI